MSRRNSNNSLIHESQPSKKRKSSTSSLKSVNSVRSNRSEVNQLDIDNLGQSYNNKRMSISETVDASKISRKLSIDSRNESIVSKKSSEARKGSITSISTNFGYNDLNNTNDMTRRGSLNSKTSRRDSKMSVSSAREEELNPASNSPKILDSNDTSFLGKRKNSAVSAQSDELLESIVEEPAELIPPSSILISELMSLRRQNYNLLLKIRAIDEKDTSMLGDLGILCEQLFESSAAECAKATQLAYILNGNSGFVGMNRKIKTSNNISVEMIKLEEPKVIVPTKRVEKPEILLLEIGSKVIALIDEHSSPKIWIHGTISSVHDGNRLKYSVLDGDPDAALRKTYTLDAYKVVPLHETAQVFQPNEKVLALFPGTTVFYPANVVRMKSKTVAVLVFEEDDDLKKEIDCLNIVALPQHIYNK